VVSDLPWNRFADEAPELPYVPPPEPSPQPLPEPLPIPDGHVPVEELPAAEPPYVPPEPPRHAAPPLTDVDVKDLARDLLAEAMDYAKATISATVKGQGVDPLHPTIVATTAAGKELVIADAKSRSWRTLVQGLIFDVFAAIVAAVALLAGADPFVKETWLAFAVLLTKSVVSAVISYFMRLRVTPTMKNEEGEKMALMPVPRPMIDKETSA
jgi:hypothetical protein